MRIAVLGVGRLPFALRKALLGQVERTCGHCAEGGGCGDDCTCAHHAV